MASAERASAARRVAAVGLALASSAGGAVPPPPQQIGADCERPSYASDQRVCGDAALRALDEQVREAWLALAASAAAFDAPAWIEPQDAWFRRRSRCAFSPRHGECLRAAYGERAAVLGDWRRVATGGPVGAGVAMQCRGAPWGSATVVVRRHETGSLTITGSDGRPLAIALPDAARDDWQPYLRFVEDGAGLRLLPLTGAAATCAAR